MVYNKSDGLKSRMAGNSLSAQVGAGLVKKKQKQTYKRKIKKRSPADHLILTSLLLFLLTLLTGKYTTATMTYYI